MPHQDATNVTRIQLNFSLDGNNASNILHARSTTRPDEAALDALAVVLDAWLVSDWKPISSSDWSALSMVLTDLTDVTGIRKTYGLTQPFVGNLAVDAFPPNATIAIKANIGRRGKGINGRVFWIGLPEDAANGSTLQTGIANGITDALTNLNTLVAQMPEYDGLCIPHFVVGGVRPPVADNSLVTSYTIADFTIDSQRTRLPNHKKKKRTSPSPTP